MFKYPIKKDNSSLRRTIWVAILSFFFLARANEFTVVTEMLKNPVGGSSDMPGDASHEFIEITNMGTDTFFIDSLFLFDNPMGVDSVMAWDTLKHGLLPTHARCIFNCPTLVPGKSAVILDPDYITAIAISPVSSLPIDSGTIIWTIDDNAFGNDGLSDNDGVALFKGTRKSINRIVAFVSDTCGPFALRDTLRQTKLRLPEGISLVPRAVFSCPPSFSSCPASLSPGHYENLKNNWLAQWQCGIDGGDSNIAVCTLTVLKVGSRPSADALWSMMRSITQTGSIVNQGFFGTNPMPMKIVMELSLDSATYQFRVNENGGMAIWNLDLSSLWTPPFAIKINEIFSRAQADVPEWFELVNTSTMNITIKNWRYGNYESSTTITQDEVALPPSGYCVITKNKKLFASKYPALSSIVEPLVWLPLDNYRDTISLWNSRGNQCETVVYNSGWFEQWTDQSIERVSLQRDGKSREAWVLAARPSPGQPNGSVPFGTAGQPGLEIGPGRFTPNGDGRDDLLSIRLSLPAAYTAAIAAYGFNGKKYVDLSSLSPQPYFWNGKTSAGAPAPVGPFYIVATFKNGSQTVILRKKGILWR
jgi:hypothetical protein